MKRHADGSASVAMPCAAEGLRGAVNLDLSFLLAADDRHVTMKASGEATGNVRAVFLQVIRVPPYLSNHFRGGGINPPNHRDLRSDVSASLAFAESANVAEIAQRNTHVSSCVFACVR